LNPAIDSAKSFADSLLSPLTNESHNATLSYSLTINAAHLNYAFFAVSVVSINNISLSNYLRNSTSLSYFFDP
jgi:hypothetical protein